MSTITRASARSKGNRPSGLVNRVQATLPGRANASKNGGGLGATVRGVLSTANAGSGPARPHTRPTKKVAGIAAGVGLGAAAVAKRRRRAPKDGSYETTPWHPTEHSPVQEVISDS